LFLLQQDRVIIRRQDHRAGKRGRDELASTYADFRRKSARADVSANDVAHFFSSRFAQQVAYLCYRAGLTPNAVTLLFLLVGIGAAISLYLGLPIACYVLWRLHIILDMADGSLARATQRFSKSAMGFDRSNHIIINTTILMASLNHGGNIYVTNAMIVAFYLSYFFSRNYYTGKQQSQHFSFVATLARSFLSIEGYILAQCLILFFGALEYLIWADLAYTVFFTLLFVFKMLRFVSQPQEDRSLTVP
jgi:phosphatidylglycerophosphate synthase